ncbi:MAG: hypothetical protein GX620_04135 [Chloroflexi bacterium]|nr:hypothetical protein [Chloroflexota bacterium]
MQKQRGESGSGGSPGKEGVGPWVRIRRILLWTLGVVLVLTLSVGGAAYLGLHRGELDRVQQRQAVAEEHYQAGLVRLDAGEYELAVAEFKYVLQLDPTHRLAQQGIDEAQARIAARPTPTTETYQIVADDLYRQATDRYEAEQWAEAVSVITQLRVLDPAYRTTEVRDMLFTSLYNAGMEALGENRLEEGIFYLDQAIALRPLDEQALTQRRLAVQYMTALGYWGADWPTTIELFGNLYREAPNYQDVFQRLYDARVKYGDAWYAQGEMCPAQEQYAEALLLINVGAVEAKRSQAEEICLTATPTPIAPITGTMAMTLTAPPPGFSIGKLAYPAYNTETGAYDVYSLFADGRLLRMAVGSDQPLWQWNGSTLVYRDRLAPGLAIWAPGQTEGRVFVPGGGLAWPSLSPDGGRIAYALQDVGGIWQIRIAPTDGTTAGVEHAEGRHPIWGPTGLLAWTGCDDSGACGIFVDNPDDDQPGTRMTASSNDIGLNWAPGGDRLVYMSDVSGNWDIYLLNIAGGVTALTDHPASDGLPAWSPDGSRIAFVSNRDGVWSIYLMNADGQDPQRMLTLGPNLPDWTSQRLSWAP